MSKRGRYRWRPDIGQSVDGCAPRPHRPTTARLPHADCGTSAHICTHLPDAAPCLGRQPSAASWPQAAAISRLVVWGVQGDCEADLEALFGQLADGWD